jgi:uncharacterized membrane protein (UPF0182 family)
MPAYPDDNEIRLPRYDAPPRPRIRRIYILLGLLFLGFLFLQNAVPLYTDWLWFREVGYTVVFSTRILVRTALFFGFGLLFFALFYGNVRFARRLAPEETDRFLLERFGPEWGQNLRSAIGWILLGGAIFLSLWAGRLAAEAWTELLEFLHATPFGVTDPVFGHDVGFYVFRLPFLRFVQGFLLVTLLLTSLAVVAIHVADRAIETLAGLPDAPPRVRGQLLALLAALAFALAFGIRLGAYDLLTANNGVFSGAGYTDLHVRLLAINVQVVLLILTGLACLVAIWRGRDFRWPLLGVGAWLTAWVVLGGFVPGIVQKFSVEPNQLARESAYIARNIQYTRLGFGLDNVRVETFPADESLTAAQLRANQDTLDNVRLWDHPFLYKVYAQIHAVKTYYKFEQDVEGGGVTQNVDIDRYWIGGRQRQVMLAARELNPSSLPREVQNWQNRRLAYTHGYGVVMSPVNKVVQGGPDYFLQGFPPTASAEAKNLKVTQPKIYYGQLNSDYVFVDTEQQEYDPTAELGRISGAKPTGTESYQGGGGIQIGNSAFSLPRLAFSLRLGDPTMLLAKSFRPTTRILFRRDIRERVRAAAPFVYLDSDPYLVVTEAGRLIWMLDGYTLSERFPYATAVPVGINPMTTIAPNYIRNSLKATVDAYDGAVQLYIADAKDPIARTYAKIFPGLLKPLEQMPADLRAHIRYPEDLFRLQRTVYATYHVDDPGVFFRQEDAWSVPNEPNADPAAASRPRPMEPYYVIMRLPEREARGQSAGTREAKPTSEEFLLMSPLSPLRREDQNILGWMCARCDGDRYGQLVLFQFPQEKSVNGPSQVIGLINSNAAISKELSLLRSSSGGSSATFGNLLVIPVENSLLYIAPLYVEATSSARLPQLQRVVVVYGQRTVMEETLAAALARLFPGYDAPADAAPEPPRSERPADAPMPPAGPGTVSPAIRALINAAAKRFDAAQQRLRQGDFAGYGAAMKELEKTLNDLRQQTETLPNR